LGENSFCNELKFFFNPKNPSSQRHFSVDIHTITRYIIRMTTKLSTKVALACHLFILNTLCALIFIFLVPFLSIYYILLGTFRMLKDFFSSVSEENSKALAAYGITKKNEEKIKINLPQPQHNSIGLN
jgi:hypothetical protein